MYSLPNYFAQAYSAGNYNTLNYQDTSSSGGTTGGTGTTGTTGGTTGTGGVLTNTGFDIALISSIACLLIFAALVIRFWKRPARDVTPKQ